MGMMDAEHECLIVFYDAGSLSCSSCHTSTIGMYPTTTSVIVVEASSLEAVQSRHHFDNNVTDVAENKKNAEGCLACVVALAVVVDGLTIVGPVAAATLIIQGSRSAVTTIAVVVSIDDGFAAAVAGVDVVFPGFLFPSG